MMPIQSNRNNKPGPDNPELYLREHYPHADQLYKRFEEEFDASVFGDPIAAKTKWTTAQNFNVASGYNRLKEIAPGVIEFCDPGGTKFLGIIFILVGLMVAIAHSLSLISSTNTIVLYVISSILILSGILMLKVQTKSIIFDAMRGTCRIGNKSRNGMASNSSFKDVARLQDIHALQLIIWSLSAPLRTTKGRQNHYYECELNLVLNDCTRLNVAVSNYSYKEELQSDAATLAHFLGKPLWDATEATFRLYEQMQKQAAYDQYFGKQL